MLKKYFEKRNQFQCPHCKKMFEEDRFWRWLLYPHMFDKYRYIKCPWCGKRSWMRWVYKEYDL